MPSISSLLTNKLLVAIIILLMAGFGVIFFHWQQEAAQKAQYNKEQLDAAISRNHQMSDDLDKKLQDLKKTETAF
jgi:uncharacterized protein HemX